MAYPLNSIKVFAYQIARNATSHAPNTSIQDLPLLVYRSAFDSKEHTKLKETLRQNGIEPQWTYGMYPFSHYHTVHEVLSILSGDATLRFGGEGDAEYVVESVNSDVPIEIDISAGDVIVVPAGVAHRHVEERHGFSMLGSYVRGVSWDMNNCKNVQEEKSAIEKIKKLPPLESDPLYGNCEDSPVKRFWKSQLHQKA